MLRFEQQQSAEGKPEKDNGEDLEPILDDWIFQGVSLEKEIPVVVRVETREEKAQRGIGRKAGAAERPISHVVGRRCRPGKFAVKVWNLAKARREVGQSTPDSFSVGGAMDPGDEADASSSVPESGEVPREKPQDLSLTGPGHFAANGPGADLLRTALSTFVLEPDGASPTDQFYDYVEAVVVASRAVVVALAPAFLAQKDEERGKLLVQLCGGDDVGRWRATARIADVARVALAFADLVHAHVHARATLQQLVTEAREFADEEAALQPAQVLAWVARREIQVAQAMLRARSTWTESYEVDPYGGSLFPRRRSLAGMGG